MKQYEIIAFGMDRSFPIVRDDDLMTFTAFHLAFGILKEGRVSVEHLRNLEAVRRFKAVNPKLRVVLTIGGWGAGGFSEAAMTRQGRELLSQSAIEIVRDQNLDGLDVDWQYPCHHQADIAADPSDKENYTLLIRQLREDRDACGREDGRHYTLSIAAGADTYWLDCTEMDKVHPYLDYVQIMTYDMRGGFQCLTGHHSALYNATGDLFRVSADTSTKAFVAAGVPAEKIVLGAAFYARRWSGVPDRHNGRFVLAQTVGVGGGNYASLVENFINKNGFTRYWDDEAKAPYLFNGDTFYSYDDPESLWHKCQYVKQNNLKGLMYWSYHEEPGHEMVPALYHGFYGEIE